MHPAPLPPTRRILAFLKASRKPGGRNAPRTTATVEDRDGSGYAARVIRLAPIAALVLGLVPLAGCPEVVRGPRLVHYNPDWFYVRHAPWRDGDAAVAALADAVCRQRSARAVPADSLELYPFDLRYAVYRCAFEAPPAEAAAARAVTGG